MKFDPDRHTISQAIQIPLAEHGWDCYDRIVKTLIEEYGFDLDESMHLDELREMVERDSHDLEKVWSSWKTYDEEIDYSGMAIEEALDRREECESTPVGIGGDTQRSNLSSGRSGKFLPAPQYRVIYADPPWSYSNKKTGGTHKSGSVQQYRTMTLEEIKNLPVWKLAHPEGCVLFCWGTIPLPEESYTTVRAWGFEYKTRHFWEKLGRLGMGFWFRGQIEECLIAVRGPVKAFRWQTKNILRAKPRNGLHSGKPEEMRKLIEEVTTSRMPNAGRPRIELFTREICPGWDCWGDEVLSPIKLIDGEWVTPNRVEGVSTK